MLKVNTYCFPTEYPKFFEMRQICIISIIHNFPKRYFKRTVARTFLCENIPRPMVSLVVLKVRVSVRLMRNHGSRNKLYKVSFDQLFPP